MEVTQLLPENAVIKKLSLLSPNSSNTSRNFAVAPAAKNTYCVNSLVAKKPQNVCESGTRI